LYRANAYASFEHCRVPERNSSATADFPTLIDPPAPCYNACVTDKPAPTPPRAPLVFPPNCRDVTAEKIGTVIGIVGATAAKATKPGDRRRVDRARAGLGAAIRRAGYSSAAASRASRAASGLAPAGSASRCKIVSLGGDTVTAMASIADRLLRRMKRRAK
jgi:hypothetical protein